MILILQSAWMVREIFIIKNRIFANSNKGTFDLIMENIALIREKYPFFDKKFFNAVIDLKQNVSCTNEFF